MKLGSKIAILAGRGALDAGSELEEIADRAADAARQAREVHVIYNNNKSDFAPRAAMTFQEIIHEHYPKMASEPGGKELAHA